MPKYVCVIGGINLDIKGLSKNIIDKPDSYQGKVLFTPGGVARNVVENLSKLNVNISLLGCIGNDSNGKFILDVLDENFIDVSNILISDEVSTASYLSLCDKTGKLVAAVNDMDDSVGKITVEYIQQKIDLIKNSKFIFLDTNLKEEVIEFIIQTANENNIPVFIDTVSIEKSDRVKNLSGTVNFLLPNLNEFNNIFGEFDIDRISWKLDSPVFKKFETIILKRGESGIVLIQPSKNSIKLFPPMKLDVTEANGAGDSFNAGFIYGLLNNYELYDSIELGICSAYFALKSVHSVSEKLNQENLLQLYRRKIQNEF
jgi:pseudouridine kinase